MKSFDCAVGQFHAMRMRQWIYVSCYEAPGVWQPFDRDCGPMLVRTSLFLSLVVLMRLGELCFAYCFSRRLRQATLSNLFPNPVNKIRLVQERQRECLHEVLLLTCEVLSHLWSQLRRFEAVASWLLSETAKRCRLFVLGWSAVLGALGQGARHCPLPSEA